MKKSLVLFLTLFASMRVLGQGPEGVKQLPQVEPFRIEKGSSFAASVPAPPEIAKRHRSPIADDITEALEIIRRAYVGGKSTTTSDLMRPAIEGMLQSLDPHSSYFDATEYTDLLNEEQSEYYGIGATIANFRRDGKIETFVLAVSPGSAAARAGLKFGDRIEEVDGEDMSGSSSDVVRDKVRGPSGSQIKLVIERAGTGKLERLLLTRSRVPYSTVPDAYMIRPGVGYIDLTEGFNFTTSAEFGRALTSLRREGLTSLIVDLRGNPGGVLDQAVKVAEKFLPAGNIIVTQKGRSRADNRVWRSANALPERMPLVLLVNGDSASASEVVAGALQDHDRALIIGEKTFGKGLVQSVMDLPAGTGLTLTTAKYFTPSGRSIQRDYSDGSLYEYFNRRGSIEIAHRPEAETDSHRKVYGGDGIAPDEILHEATLTREQTSLLDPAFFFVRDLLAGKVRTVSPSAIIKAAADSSTKEDAVVAAEFRKYVSENRSFDVSHEAADNLGRFAAARIRYYLAVALNGNAVGRREDLKDDALVRRAIELFPRAAELAKASTRSLRASNQK